MFNDLTPDARWTQEFAELGAKAVRRALVSAGWENEKKVAARRWLERQDVASWRSGQQGKDPEKATLGARLRKSQKVWLLVAGGIFLIMVALRYFAR